MFNLLYVLTMVTFSTINCNGLRTSQKIDLLKTLIDREKVDIVFLQETHVDSLKLGNEISNSLGGRVIWSFSQPRGKGVGIFLSNSLSFTIHHFQFDPLGRFVVVDLEVDSTPFRLVNIYAPNIPSVRKEFYIDLYPLLLSSRTTILAGDFNCVQNVNLDKRGGNAARGRGGWTELSSLLTDFDLVDVYRSKFPTQVAATWRGRGVSCRLDRIYISSSLIPSVRTIEHVINPVSDHDLVVMRLSPLSPVNLGKGYWKFNNTLLKDPDFCGKINQVLYCASQETPRDDSILTWWDDLKGDFKEIALEHSKIRRKQQLAEHNALSAQYLASEKAGKQDQMKRIKDKLKELDINHLAGAQIRSRAYLLDNREKPSRYFYRKELSQGKKKIIKEVIDKDGNKCSTSNTIVNTFFEFYQTLYKEEDVNPTVVDEFLCNLPKVKDEEAELLGDDVMQVEIETSIGQMENNKSPGPDGLPKEFYACFLSQLCPILLRVYHTMYELGNMSDSQKMSYITLLCKDEKHPEQPKNYRPISLLNVDYKILTKVLCNRLRPILETIVHPDQTCAVPGRSIIDSCNLIRDQLDFCNSRNCPGILLSIDQEKAFDRVSHHYMLSTLKAFGLGDKFVRWIATLYSNISSCVIVNQHVSAPFAVERSVRQGCPLSPLIYVLCLEPVLCKIRRDPAVTGLHVPGNREESKVAAFADDSKFLLSGDSSARTVLRCFNRFGLASGAKLNKTKTEGMYLGRWRSRKDDPLGISWVQRMTVFGILVGSVTPDDIWHPIAKKIENTMRLFKCRLLSLYGRAKLVNVMILSKLWYVATVVPPPRHYVKLVQKRAFDFLWSSRNEPVRRETMYLSVEEGGVGVVNIRLKVQSLLLMQVSKVVLNRDSPWVGFGHMFLGLRVARLNCYQFSNKHPHCSRGDAPYFYQQCLQAIEDVQEAQPDVSFTVCSCKRFYGVLQAATAVIPKVVSTFPQIPFKQVFKDLACTSLDPTTLNVCFKLAHDVLPVAYKLYLWNYPVVRFCLMCHTQCETVEHLFYFCPFVRPARDLMFSWVHKVSSMVPTMETIRFGPLGADTTCRTTTLVLLAEYRYAVWVCRNKVRFDKKRPVSQEITRYLMARLVNRIHVDRRRLPPDKFANLWTLPGLCKVNLKGQTVTMLT